MMAIFLNALVLGFLGLLFIFLIAKPLTAEANTRLGNIVTILSPFSVVFIFFLLDSFGLLFE